MTRDFDDYAVDAIERKRERRATWDEFCNRHDFDDHRYSKKTTKARWSRKTFKYALQRMPKDHPDRWKYKIGAQYAPFMNADGMEETWAMIWFIGNLLFVCVGVPSILMGISTPVHLFFLIPIIPLYAGYWLYWVINRYRKLSL